MPIGNLTRLQRAHLPNIPVLKGLIAWFDAVSEFVDDFFTTQPTFLAGARVDGAGTFSNGGSQQYGYTSITHPGPGIYNLFVDPVDSPLNYVLSVSLATLTIADTVLYDIGVQFVGANEMRVRIYSLADTAAPTIPTPADHDFYIEAKRLPGF